VTDPDPLAALGEFGLIERLARAVLAGGPGVDKGVGDDAAILTPAPGRKLVVTVDVVVEGRHFTAALSEPADWGWKAVAVNLSDLAAMGAEARTALLSLVLPGDLEIQAFDDLINGFLSLAKSTGTTLIGGNMARSPGPIVIDVTAVGSVRPRAILTRRGARPGDRLFVTGTVGGAAAGLEMLAAGLDRAGLDDNELACIERQEQPQPRLRMGRIVGRTRAAAAAIDLSDGLADGAIRLAEAEGIGVIVDAAAVPVPEGALSWWARRGLEPVGRAVAGGEDYELAFAVRPRQRSRLLAAARRCTDLRLTEVGEFVKEPGAWLVQDGSRRRLEVGFGHF
jgi:thiamine-monophosphate kinase